MKLIATETPAVRLEALRSAACGRLDFAAEVVGLTFQVDRDDGNENAFLAAVADIRCDGLGHYDLLPVGFYLISSGSGTTTLTVDRREPYVEGESFFSWTLEYEGSRGAWRDCHRDVWRLLCGGRIVIPTVTESAAAWQPAETLGTFVEGLMHVHDLEPSPGASWGNLNRRIPADLHQRLLAARGPEAISQEDAKAVLEVLNSGGQVPSDYDGPRW